MFAILERVQEDPQYKNDLTDTEEALIQDTKFLKELKSDCATTGSEYEANQKTRSAGLLAPADTIKILNDDDSLEIFKKTPQCKRKFRTGNDFLSLDQGADSGYGSRVAL